MIAIIVIALLLGVILSLSIAIHYLRLKNSLLLVAIEEHAEDAKQPVHVEDKAPSLTSRTLPVEPMADFLP